MTSKAQWVALVAVAIIAIGGYFFPQAGVKLFGDISNCFNSSATCFTSLYASTNFQLSSKGTTQSNQVVKTCSMKADNSIAASSTGYAYCTGVTGVTSSDFVQAVFSTSTAAITQTADNWEILSAKASTTAGAIDFILVNDTGKAAVPSAVGRMGSTTDIWAAH